MRDDNPSVASYMLIKRGKLEADEVEKSIKFNIFSTKFFDFSSAINWDSAST